MGKIAVVTGSSKGIGFAMAKEFAENNGRSLSSVLENRSKQQGQ
jgi:NAD(P)-dependent dehydrogenase (short-subunit alcohol dehydrogenase family)